LRQHNYFTTAPYTQQYPHHAAVMAPGIVDKMASRLHRMSHSSSEGKNESKEVFTAREEEKARLASWQADTKPLEVSEIIVDPQTKPVGHSSKLLVKRTSNS
jgi:protein kinase A